MCEPVKSKRPLKLLFRLKLICLNERNLDAAVRFHLVLFFLRLLFLSCVEFFLFSLVELIENRLIEQQRLINSTAHHGC